jgi:APA family basic amino acid/polyamine antiporter
MTDEVSSNQVFLRKSSGLVKSAGPLDVFIYNFGLISVGIAITLAHFWVPPNYAGASLPLAEILAGLFMAFIAWTFWCWSVAIPRSGGIYAYISRGLSPALGFAVSFVDTFVWLFYNALAATFLITIGIGPALFAAGHFTGSRLLVEAAIALQAPGWKFAIGAAAIVAAGVLLAVGMRAFFVAQKVVLVLATVGTMAAVVILAGTSHEDFLSNFDAALAPFGISSASLRSSSPLTPWHFSWQATLLAAVWPVLSYVGSIFSVNIGGEVRNSARSQAVGMFGSILTAAAVMAMLSWLGDSVFGQEFQATLGTFALGDGGKALPLPPYYSLLAALASGNPILAVILCVGFLAWAFFWIPATIAYATRAVIAWSFDRVAPAALGYVHPTRHTPVIAIAAVVVINLLFLALFLFTPFFGTLVLVLAAMLAWIPTMLGALIFPYLRPELFARSGMGGSRLLGIPTIVIAGSFGLVAVLVLTVLLWNDEVAAGHSPQSLATIGVVFGVGFVWYLAARVVRRWQGLEIDRAFREIPIE